MNGSVVRRLVCLYDGCADAGSLTVPDWLKAVDTGDGIELRPNWRPVTDPPPLGVEVILCDERTGETLVGFRVSDGTYGVFAETAGDFDPTHWMAMIPIPGRST